MFAVAGLGSEISVCRLEGAAWRRVQGLDGHDAPVIQPPRSLLSRGPDAPVCRSLLSLIRCDLYCPRSLLSPIFTVNWRTVLPSVRSGAASRGSMASVLQPPRSLLYSMLYCTEAPMTRSPHEPSFSQILEVVYRGASMIKNTPP